MRILHIDTGTGWRGGQQQLFWLLQELCGRGLEQLLLAPKDSPLAARVRSQGRDVEELSNPATSLANIRRVRQHTGCDVVHAHDSHAHTLAFLARLGRGGVDPNPLIVSRRVAFSIGRLGKPKYAAPDRYIAVSEFVRQRLVDAGVPEKKIRVIYDGVPMPADTTSVDGRKKFRRKQEAAEDSFVFGTLASMAPEKLLCEEIELLAEFPKQVRLWLAFPKAEAIIQAQTTLLQHANRLGVQNRVRFLPLDEDATNFMASLDGFLYLSKCEGLGSAILLAMAHGLPVVASEVGGIPEIVHHRNTGLLLALDRKKDWANMVRPLLESPDLRQCLGCAGKQFVQTHATCEIMAAKTAAVYEEVLSGTPQRRSASE